MKEETLKNINDWLESDNPDLEEGALLLLKLNKNRILYRNIVAKKLVDKLRYELRKIKEIYEQRLKVDYKGLTDTEKQKLFDGKNKAMESIAKQNSEETKKGKREDHEDLSTEAQVAYDRNMVIYNRMRAVHEKLKLMDTDCDRYPFIQELVALDKELQANWELYDNATVIETIASEATNGAKEGSEVTDQTPKGVLSAKEVSNARKYLSDNKSKLATYKSEKDEKKYTVLLTKMQERLDKLLKDGQGMDDDHLQELLDLGLVRRE